MFIIKKEDIYLIANIGKIVANYQPGHAHAGTFSFELSLFKERFIVNSGISTYENNSIRALERNTLSHSTVCVDNKILQKSGLVLGLLEDLKFFVKK